MFPPGSEDWQGSNLCHWQCYHPARIKEPGQEESFRSELQSHSLLARYEASYSGPLEVDVTLFKPVPSY